MRSATHLPGSKKEPWIHDLCPFADNLIPRGSGTSINTKWANQKFGPMAWDGKDDAHPDGRIADAEANPEFPAPPRGYCVYAPVND
jgi:alpha-amylase